MINLGILPRLLSLSQKSNRRCPAGAGAHYDADGSIETAENEKMVLKIGDLRPKRLFGEGDPLNMGVLVRFHEDVDGFLAALRADLEVVPVVRKGLFAPLAPLDTRGLHLGDFFEQ